MKRRREARRILNSLPDWDTADMNETYLSDIAGRPRSATALTSLSSADELVGSAGTPPSTMRQPESAFAEGNVQVEGMAPVDSALDNDPLAPPPPLVATALVSMENDAGDVTEGGITKEEEEDEEEAIEAMVGAMAMESGRLAADVIPLQVMTTSEGPLDGESLDEE